MTYSKIGALLVILAAVAIALAFLTSCVSVPVPPFGPHTGDAGNLNIRVAVSFEPRVPNAPSLADDHAWREFLKTAPTRTLHDK